MKIIRSIIFLSLSSIPLTTAAEPETGLPRPLKPDGGPEVVQIEKPASQTEAIPEKYAAERAIAIKLEDLRPIGERLHMRAILRIINPTNLPMVFTGFSETHPVTKRQRWVDGKWVEEEKTLRCGTGLRQCVIAPGQSAVFSESVHPETMPSRIGIAYRLGDKRAELIVWSEKIER